MSDQEILNWLKERRLISEFIHWTGEQGQAAISRRTYYRATENNDNPPRQQYALRLAREFYLEQTKAKQTAAQ